MVNTFVLPGTRLDAWNTKGDKDKNLGFHAAYILNNLYS